MRQKRRKPATRVEITESDRIIVIDPTDKKPSVLQPDMQELDETGMQAHDS